jgi:hypothetical protein
MGIVAWISRKLQEASAARAERRRLEALESAARRYQAEEDAWNAEAQELQRELSLAKNPRNIAGTEPGPLVLHKNEYPVLIGHGAVLVEPKRLPGEWVGGYSGFSFRIMRGVSYHTGGTRGTYVSGPEAPTPIATGTITITNQRVVFQSDKQAREFSYAKLLGYQHDPTLPVTYLQVSNRQKVSGILYDAAYARTIRFRFALGVAEYRGETDSLISAIRSEIAKHDSARPARPVGLLANTSSQPASS